MPVTSINRWGAWSAFVPVTSSVAGPVNKVLGNVGLAIQIVAGSGSIRLSHIGYRVDLAPDQPANTVNSPTRWRLVVLDGQLPADVSAFQQQAYPNGAHPEVPAVQAPQAAPGILLDRWLDFAVNDPGLNLAAVIDFADGGPAVGATRTMSILLVPIQDANLAQTLLGGASALMYLEAFGTAAGNLTGQTGGPQTDRSLPRYDSVQSPG